MPTEEVERHYEKYWKLQNLHQLYYYYENGIKQDLPAFLKLFTRIREEGITNNIILATLRNLRDCRLNNMNCKIMRKEGERLRIYNDSLRSKNASLEKSIASAQVLLDDILSKVQRQSSKIML